MKSLSLKKRLKRIALFCSLTVCLVIVVCLGLSTIYDSDRSGPGAAAQHPVPSSKAGQDRNTGQILLKVMTINLAHGRKHKAAQIFKREAAVKRNLDDVAAVLRREAPDLVALQEADGPSIWSGSFDHVAYLAESAGFPFSLRGEHVKGPGLSYGTALLSRFRFDDTASIAFRPSWPTFTKGMVVGTVCNRNLNARPVGVVSVHLDFSRESVRRKQLDELAEELDAPRRLLIVMGDFNCDWMDGDAMLAGFAKRLGLKTDRPLAAGLETHSMVGKRIDWILVSEEMEIAAYRILSEQLSDHSAVVAEIRLPARGE